MDVKIEKKPNVSRNAVLVTIDRGNAYTPDQLGNVIKSLASQTNLVVAQIEKLHRALFGPWEQDVTGVHTFEHVDENSGIIASLADAINANFVTTLALDYNESTHTVVIGLYTNDNTMIDSVSFNIPMASSTKDGLMSSVDKVKIDGMNITIDSKVSAHDSSDVAHADIRQDITDLDGRKADIVGGKVPSNQLPSYVDDVIEVATKAALPITGETSKLYVVFADESSNGNNSTYRWTGSVYIKVSDELSASEVKALYEANANTNVLTDVLKAKLVDLYNQSTLVAMFNDRYTKVEVDAFLDSLKTIYGWSETTLATLTNSSNTVSKITIDAVDFVILQFMNTEDSLVHTQTFKPSALASGKNISIGSVTFGHNGTTYTATGLTAGDSLLIIGIQMEGHDETYVTVEHHNLTSDITATTNVEIIDDTGAVIEVEGNEPTNLIVNSDLLIPKASPNENEPLGFNFPKSTNISLSGGIVTFTPTAINASMSLIDVSIYNTNDIYYRFARVKSTSVNFGYIYPNNFYSQVGEWELLTSITSGNRSYVSRLYEQKTSGFTPIEVDYIGAYNISDMINKGIKADDGRLLGSLTDGELKAQMDIWMTNGFPTVINKIVSKSDNLFDSEFYPLTDLESENLVSNSDLLIPKASPNENEPLGFTYSNATDITLVNGIAKFTATAQFAKIYYPYTALAAKYYIFARYKADSSLVRLRFSKGTITDHTGSGNFEYISMVNDITAGTSNIEVNDYRSSGFTPIEVDYMGAYNITDLVSRGILPSGLTDAQYKDILDNALYNNVPLRETSLISVEPSTAYKFIKASDNTPIHKVVEYATDGQVVKVSALTYTDHKATFTTQPQTTKIKLVSDLMNRPAQLLNNPNFDNGTTGWFETTGSYPVDSFTVSNGQAIVVVSLINAGIWQSSAAIAGHTYYYSMKLSNTERCYFETSLPYSMNIIEAGTGQVFSKIHTHNETGSALVYIRNYNTGANTMTIDYMIKYDITDFKNAGVVNDTGTLFSRLTNNEIKEQMDIWTETGFPDHVIAALYPNGVDNAIALKYNGADDIFRPQAIDTLTLNLTLRSGEKWKDGYVIKQNGNAEYYPLQTKFSAWNYGQLQAIYTSGIPADFKIQYAQNIGAQVKTTNEFLVEAREQIDYVTDGYNNLVEKLGEDIFDDDFDSYAGITSSNYEYYGLQGIKEGNKLAVEGVGQSILNLLPASIPTPSATVNGVTVTYDSTTGFFTANGTSTAAGNLILKTGIDLDLSVGTDIQLMRYYDGLPESNGTVNLNGSYIGYLFAGATVSNRINENSESLYDPYINGVGKVTAPGTMSGVAGTTKHSFIFQFYKAGMVFDNFKFKLGLYEGLQLRPFVMPATPSKSSITVYNRTLNKLNITSSTIAKTANVDITYDEYTQEFLLSGTANATASVSLNATFAVKSGDRISIKRLYQSGDVTGVGGVLPRLKLDNAENTTIVYNDIYKMTAPEGQTPTPDVSFSTGTAPEDGTLTLKLSITSGQVFDNYRFRLMIHDKSSDVGYVEYKKETIGTMLIGANEKAYLTFNALPFGLLEFVTEENMLNILYGDTMGDLRASVLEYNAGIGSSNRKISSLEERATLIDNVFKDKVIALWGDSRESNNPTSDPTGVGDQKDTSWPALLAKKLGAKVLNFGLSGGAWAQNTAQQDAASAIVNRVQTEDVSASADIIIISSMNDFKLATPLGLPTSTTITDYYGAIRITFQRLAAKYPGKKIVVVLPQKRFDEGVKYGNGASYYAYRKAQIDVCKEYGISTVDLYNNFPNSKLGPAPTAYTTNMMNDTHFTAAGNDVVAELVARHLIGNGNSGSVDSLPPIPTTDGTYKLQVVITGGVPVFSWVS